MRFRTVADVVFAEAHAMGPLTVRQPLPSAQLPYLDPFLLLHHPPPKDFRGAPGGVGIPLAGLRRSPSSSRGASGTATRRETTRRFSRAERSGCMPEAA